MKDTHQKPSDVSREASSAQKSFSSTAQCAGRTLWQRQCCPAASADRLFLPICCQLLSETSRARGTWDRLPCPLQSSQRLTLRFFSPKTERTFSSPTTFLKPSSGASNPVSVLLLTFTSRIHAPSCTPPDLSPSPEIPNSCHTWQHTEPRVSTSPAAQRPAQTGAAVTLRTHPVLQFYPQIERSLAANRIFAFVFQRSTQASQSCTGSASRRAPAPTPRRTQPTALTPPGSARAPTSRGRCRPPRGHRQGAGPAFQGRASLSPAGQPGPAKEHPPHRGGPRRLSPAGSPEPGRAATAPPPPTAAQRPLPAAPASLAAGEKGQEEEPHVAPPAAASRDGRREEGPAPEAAPRGPASRSCRRVDPAPGPSAAPIGRAVARRPPPRVRTAPAGRAAPARGRTPVGGPGPRGRAGGCCVTDRPGAGRGRARNVVCFLIRV